MDENLHNIEDLFWEGLEDNEERPSPHVWNDIENVLDKENAIIIRKKYASLKKITLLLLLLLFGVIVYELGSRLNNKELAKRNYISKHNDTVNNHDPNNSVSYLDARVPQNGNYPIENKIALTNNTARNVSTSKLNNQGNTNNLVYNDKVNNRKPIEDRLQMVAGSDAVENNRQFYLLEQLHHKAIEKIDSRMEGFIYTRYLAKPGKINLTMQNTVATSTRKKRGKLLHFSMTPFFSPDAAWYHLHEDMPGNQPDSLAKIERDERHEFSSTFGVLVDYKLSMRWSLQSGLTYSNTNITVNPKTIYAQTDNNGHVQYRINTSSGYGFVLPSFSNNPVIGDSLYAVASAHSLLYIGVPVAIKYNIAKGRFTVNTLAGLATNFLIKGKIETTVIKGMNNETELLKNIQGLKKIYFSGITGLGIDYKLSKRLALSFDPTLKFAVNSINHNAPVKSYPNSFEFATGLKLEL